MRRLEPVSKAVLQSEPAAYDPAAEGERLLVRHRDLPSSARLQTPQGRTGRHCRCRCRRCVTCCACRTASGAAGACGGRARGAAAATRSDVGACRSRTPSSWAPGCCQQVDGSRRRRRRQERINTDAACSHHAARARRALIHGVGLGMIVTASFETQLFID
jgi:hypothetical protein